MKDKLFIIGNGFDMAHDLKTNYLYFKRFVYQQAYGKDELLESLQGENAIKLYLKRLDEEILEYIEDFQIPEIQMGTDGEDWYPDDEVLFQLLYQLISQITKPEDFWSDFEEKLAKFDKVSIETMNLTDKDGDTDYTSMAHNANELGETLAKYVSYSLNKLFKEWIEETYSEWYDRILTQSGESQSKLLKNTILNNSDAIFLNFNYTKTLEDLYRIPAENVFHIHGCIGESEIVYGHGSNNETDDFNPLNVGAYLEELVNKLKKPTDKIISDNQSFFGNITSIEEIYIIGFGIKKTDGVDSPYFKEIFKQIPKVKIYVDMFDKDDKCNIKNILNTWGAHTVYKLEFIDTEKDKIVGGNI